MNLRARERGLSVFSLASGREREFAIRFETRDVHRLAKYSVIQRAERRPRSKRDIRGEGGVEGEKSFVVIVKMLKAAGIVSSFFISLNFINIKWVR